jgi:hypothetical protein
MTMTMRKTEKKMPRGKIRRIRMGFRGEAY